MYFFADCAWIALATAYVITVILQRQRILTDVLHDNHFYYLGMLLFAFTLFHAYVDFAQYFVIWNGNMPEETFWYIHPRTWFVVVDRAWSSSSAISCCRFSCCCPCT